MPTKIPKRIAKLVLTLSLILASLVLVVLLSTAGSIYWILNYPESAWRFASRYILPDDLKVTWESMDFDWRKKAWNEWGFAWSTKNLAVTKGQPKVNAGVSTAEAKWGFNFLSDKPTFEFERIDLQTREKSFVQLEPSKEKSPEQSIYQMVNNALGYLSQSNKFLVFHSMNVKVVNFQLRMANQDAWDLNGSAIKLPHPAINQEIQFNISALSKLMSAEAKGYLNGRLLGTQQQFLQIETQVKTADWSVQGTIYGVFHNEKLSVQSKPRITISGSKSPTEIQPEIALVLAEKGMDVKTQMDVTGVPGPVVHLNKITALMHMPFENDVMWAEVATTLQAEIPIDLFLVDKDMRAPLEKACRCKLPEEFQASVNGKAWLEKYFGQNKTRQKLAEIRVKFKSVKNKLFSADLAADVNVFGENHKWSFEPKLDADIMIHSFQGLREYLDAKGVIIPAPLDVLEGTIGITAKSPISSSETNLHTAVQIALDFKSPTQAVMIDSKVILELANTFKSLDIDVDALIRTLSLDLPPLDPVLGIPALASDPRILRQAPKKVKPQFQVRVVTRVRTEKAGAIRLSSKFAKPNVPISVLVNAVGADSTGYVRFEPFAVSYLRRKIFVEKVNISLAKNDEDDLPVEGRFRIEQGGYKIFITMSGTVQSPSVLFSSEPMLSKNDIISVLLYGRVANQLVSNEAETTGNVNAALTDKAVGIFGLWAFASTPIQSFSYNATTKVYTATVDLGNGVTAGVGTNWEQATNFELRKRVSSRWVLTASWAPNQYNRQEGRLVLQWEKRF